QLQRRRNDLPRLLMYLTERRILFSINHVFSSLTGRRETNDFAWFRDYFPAIETRNGHMLLKANAHATRLARRWQKIGIGGSDAHALASVGATYTDVPGARTKQEFFDGLKTGQGRVRGESGCFMKLTRDVFLIAREMMREKPWTALLAPLALAVPVMTLWNYRDEQVFLERWSAELFGERPGRGRIRWAATPTRALGEWA
ncbi:MAG: PHP domain-containing protein, partial [Acidobacteriota bacterium]|nr:PHP domain-containing protein [Acidobacteriota bacterium]